MRAKVFLILSLVLLCATLSACNTTAGVGKDVSSAGHAVERGAEHVKDKL